MWTAANLRPSPLTKWSTTVDEQRRREYWGKNLRLMLGLLIVWFIVSFVFGIFLVETLNDYTLLGAPLGFWFAQQGSIITFVGLILIYCLRMDKVDDEFGVSERDEEGERL